MAGIPLTGLTPAHFRVCPRTWIIQHIFWPFCVQWFEVRVVAYSEPLGARTHWTALYMYIFAWHRRFNMELSVFVYTGSVSWVHLVRCPWNVQCVRAPKGSVVNFTAYQNFIELIQIILKYIEVLSLWSLSRFRYNF
jgi:hypothetical protein